MVKGGGDIQEKGDPRLSIGVFSRRSRLSMKALRLYERQGLLVPDSVDSSNGYRWYRESQLATARLILMLRRIDMPLPAVADVVEALGPSEAKVTGLADRSAPSGGERAAAMIAAYWAEVEERVAVQRELAQHLQIRLLGRNGRRDEMYTIQERVVPEQTVVTEQRHLLAAELPEWIEAAMGRLWPIAERLGGVTGPAIVIYHGEVNEESDGPVEVCLPVSPGDKVTDAPLRIEPAHREAFTRIRKAQVAYPQILSAYDAVGEWIMTNGHPMAGSPREVYFADFGAAQPDDEVCDIAFPIG